MFCLAKRTTWCTVLLEYGLYTPFTYAPALVHHLEPSCTSPPGTLLSVGLSRWDGDDAGPARARWHVDDESQPVTDAGSGPDCPTPPYHATQAALPVQIVSQ